MRKILLIVILLSSFLGFSQKKILQTKFISDKITIDGKMNETIWKSASVATDFVMLEPDNGKPISENKKTEIKVLYDNEALYIVALLYDDEPNKILKEITQRDDFGTADQFGVFINGNNDGQQDFRFIVSASDGQSDCLAIDRNGEDYSWDAVWKSKALITDFGWVVEMRIPYAALRFSSERKQTWGINFFRKIERDRQKYTWNYVDAKLGTFTQQTGVLEGIENIKTPTRLFLLPYSSYYLNANAAQKTYGTIKGGLDIKYGINDAFTLDVILIPDFGQTKYDNQILNLGPFEQQFNENRDFFTEGTDLFSKGSLLYSRRIGGNPSNYPTKAANEEILDNPSNVNLINAFKVSGRTKNGLGIGILNAVTEKTSAVIRNTDTQEIRREVVEPLANYNVLVLDQRFRKNSSLTLVNTNVIRDGNFRDANVSALLWDLNTKENTFNLSGDFKYSDVNDIIDKKGIATSLNFGENSGKYRYYISSDFVSKNYDNNDLGINFETNYYNLRGNANYRILNPTKLFNSFRTNVSFYNQFQKETGKLQKTRVDLNINASNKKNNSFGFGVNANLFETYDYYEPRTENRFVIIPERYSFFVFYSSNYNKKFALDINPFIAIANEKNRIFYEIEIGPRYRFNDKLALNYNLNFSSAHNNKGFVDSIDQDLNSVTPNTIIFSNRNLITYSNSLSVKYSISSKMNFNLSLRQYWSYAENKNFLSLEQNGRLKEYAGYTENKNSNFNSWNADVSYTWWFAPGSQISILYRNVAANFERDIDKNFGKNITNLLNNDALSHIFSVSIKYFIDYNELKNKA
ncbi:DUF5916 domain-containing protein [Flavobacterium sp.]|uniref:DUF5916 domain-containing protein n=1 Tax=Flavobacterium sp. TaxID=239 RepID=UPI00286B6460|nr:DUF5916 domain-containing protein [Flavobacterium sp.]